MLRFFHYSVVILAKKSGQIANKGSMMYYGRCRSQLTFPKNPKQTPVQIREINKNYFSIHDRLRKSNFSKKKSILQRMVDLKLI